LRAKWQAEAEQRNAKKPNNNGKWSALADDFRTFLLVTRLPGMQSVAHGSRPLLV
jgi:hypothetical protein